jgi:hypothetical protein
VRSETRRERRLAAESRADPYARRRWPWVAGAIVVAIAVTVGGVLWRDRNGTKAAVNLAPAQIELARSAAVPSPVRGDCKGLKALPAGAAVGLVCRPSEGASRVTFLRYPTTDALTQAFDQRLPAGVTRDSTDDCADVVDVEHPYTTAQTMSGNVACFHQNGHSVLVWTMPSVTTLGVAERDDRQDQLLYDWWNVGYRVRLDQGADPATFTEEQSALLAHVPEAVRTTCQSAELLQSATASLTCSSGNTDVFYTSYPDAATMSSVYEAQRAASGVVTDSRVSAPDACPGEGPYRADGADAGRFLCYTDKGVARATWTDGQFSILAEAIRTDDQFAPLVLLVGRLGPS